MDVDASLAPIPAPISIGKSFKSSHETLLLSKTITSVFVALFDGYPVDINILVHTVEEGVNEIYYGPVHLVLN